MASSGPHFPGTGSNQALVGTLAWSTPGRITASDNSRAAATSTGASQQTNYLTGTNVNPGLPATAVVNGVLLEIERSESDTAADVFDAVVSLVANGVVAGDNKASGVEWSTTEGFVSYGGSTDSWGLTLSGAEVNASNFGAVLSATIGASGKTASADSMRFTFYYTVPNNLSLLGVGG